MNSKRWESLLRVPGSEGRINKGNSPVVKITVGEGGENAHSWFGLLGPLQEGKYGRKTGVLSIDDEVSPQEVHMCLSGLVSLNDLEAGKIVMASGRRDLEVEFAGLASDPEHKDREWSCQF